MNAPDPRPSDSSPDARPRRRYSAWTLLAPITLVVVVVLLFNAAGSAFKSDKGSGKKDTTTSTSSNVATKLAPGKNVYKVHKGDTAESIASKFGLTVAQLKACNPDRLADSYSIQAGVHLRVVHAASGTPCTEVKTDNSAI